MDGFNACHLSGYDELNHIKSETLMLRIVVMVKKFNIYCHHFYFLH